MPHSSSIASRFRATVWISIGLVMLSLMGRSASAQASPVTKVPQAKGVAEKQVPDAGGQAPVDSSPASAPPIVADAAREALIAVDPQSPSRALAAVESLLRLGYPEDARQLLSQEKWSPLQKEKLVREWGTFRLLELGKAAGMDEASRQRIVGWMSVAKQEAISPARIRERLTAWLVASPGKGRALAEELRPAGLDLLPVACDVAKAAAPAERSKLASLIASLGPATIPPLLTLVADGDRSAQEFAVQVGSAIDPTIAVPAPNVMREARERAWLRSAELERSAAERGGARGNIWRWQDGHLVRESVSPETAEGWLAWQWSRRILATGTASEDDLARDLLINLYVDQQLGDWHQPLPDGPGSALEMARQRGWNATARAATGGLKSGPEMAVVAVLEGLGRIPPEAGGNRQAQAVLWQALRHGHPRVRFAALESLLRTCPMQDQAGASRLVDHLAWFAASRGKSRVLVLGGPAAASRQLAGTLRDVGMEAEVVGSALTGLRRLHGAEQGPVADFVAIFASTAVDMGHQEFERQLAQDAWTSRLPVWWFEGDQIVEPQAWEFRTTDASLGTFSADVEGVGRLVGLLTEQRGPYALTAAERSDQAARALMWLQHAAADKIPEVLTVVRRRPAVVEGLQGSGTLRSAAESLLRTMETASHTAP